MKTSRTNLRVAPIATAALTLLICSLGVSAGEKKAEDCDRAKAVYASATKVLNYEERRQKFQDAVKLCPSFAEARVNLADALENLASMSGKDVERFNNLLDRAAEEYRAAIRIKGDLFAARLGLGDTLRVMGLYAESKEAYEQALKLKPGDVRAASGLEKVRAIVSQESGGFKRAADIVKHFRTSSGDGRGRSLMGFARTTVVKDRLRFNNILFTEWSSEIRPGEPVEQVQEIGTALSSSELSSQTFVIEGHTCDLGGLQRNLKLSEDRANSVRSYLLEHFSIDPARVETKGFGYSRPGVPNTSEVNRAQNRRVEVLILDSAYSE